MFAASPHHVVFAANLVESLPALLELYGEHLNDANELKLTIWARRDSSDTFTLRAASIETESPISTNDGRLASLYIYPTSKILAAIANGELPGVELKSLAEILELITT